MAARRKVLLDIVEEGRPMTVRQAFYQATVLGLIEKTENGYAKVQSDLVWLRRNGDMPFHWLADNTRWQRKPRTFDDVETALRDTATMYRKSLWRDAKVNVEIWLEKDALSGVIGEITYKYDVPLMVARGYASLSFLHTAAEDMEFSDKPTHVYHLGDFDPSGVNAGEKIEQTLRELAPNAEIHFERLAVNKNQIRKWRLPSRPTKKSDSRAKNFDSEISVELDAIPPQKLRDLVESAINRHLPQEELKVLLAAEEDERRHFIRMADMLSDNSHAYDEE